MIHGTGLRLGRTGSIIGRDEHADGIETAPMLRSAARFLMQHRSQVAVSAGMGLLAGLLYLLFSNPVYTAETQILVDPGIQSVVREQGAPSQTPLDSPQIETEIAVLRSEEIAKTVAQRFDIKNDPEFAPRRWSDMVPSIFMSKARHASYEQEREHLALDAFSKRLVVRRIGVSYAINIYFTSRDAQRSAKFANAFADAYMQFQLNARKEAARVGSQWLGGLLTELRQEMNAASVRMQEFRLAQNYRIGRRPDQPSVPSSAPLGTNVAATILPRDLSDPKVNASMTLEELESTANTYRRSYESALQAYMATVQRQSFPIYNARVITVAIPPLSQSRSGMLILLASCIAGVLLWAAVYFAGRRLENGLFPGGLVGSGKSSPA